MKDDEIINSAPIRYKKTFQVSSTFSTIYLIKNQNQTEKEMHKGNIRQKETQVFNTGFFTQ